ncbi:MAG: ACT domain-containing protein [Pseudomonadota bacterium]
MPAHLVISFIADDRPGLVGTLSQAVIDSGGNWCESRFAHLAEKFAGIVRVEMPDSDRAATLKERLAALEPHGILVTVTEADDQIRPHAARLMLDIVGPDQPGIVQEITHCLAQNRISIETMETDTESAPMGGGMLFRARLELNGPADTDQDLLLSQLEQIASALIVDLELNEVPKNA